VDLKYEQATTNAGFGRTAAQVIRLHTFIDSAAWVDTGASGEKHGPIFTVKTDISQPMKNWVCRQCSVIGGNTSFAASVQERESGRNYKGRNYKVSIKFDSGVVVKAQRHSDQTEYVTWGPKKAAHEDVLRQFQLYRDRIK